MTAATLDHTTKDNATTTTQPAPATQPQRPKAGRPAIGMQVERVTMSVPPYLLARMQAFANHSGYSKSDVMRQALEVYLTPRGF